MTAPPPRPPLWLALHFPDLPIERLVPDTRAERSDGERHDDEQDDGADDLPRAVIVTDGPTRRVLACNAAAREANVQPGLSLNHAWALAPELAIEPFDEAARANLAARLEQLTFWALGFSSRVTPYPPDALLLEIGASLRLFGGLKPLLVAVRESLAALGVGVSRGVAPTPAAALLFARVGQPRPVRERARLAAVLATIPLERLPLDELLARRAATKPATAAASATTGLARSGIRDLGALVALPPKALARRFGSGLCDWLYRLDGRLPDPQPAWQPPATFASALDLPLEARDTAALGFVLRRLLAALGGFLTAGDVGVRRLDLVLFHHRKPPTTVSLRFLDPTACTAHLARVATERLGGTVLAAPVIRLALEAAELAPVERVGRGLFDGNMPGAVPGAGTTTTATTSGAAPSGIERVIDRLTARLGPEALYTAMPGDDHRPERAWMQALLEVQRPPSHWPARPLWLYREPRVAARSLQILSSAERIENGWWDEIDVRRDYCIGRDAAGSHYWVFRSRRDPDRLWVHGLFG